MFSAKEHTIVAVTLLLLAFGIVASFQPAYGQYVSDETIEVSSPDPDERFGGAVARVGVDGGDPILVVGAKDAEGDATGRTGAGKAYLVNGSDGTVRSTLNSQNETTQGDFGAAVGVVDDVTGDGFPDVVVGAPSEDPSDASVESAGVVYVFNGMDGSFVEKLQTTVGNIEDGRRFGAAVAGIGDVNGDDAPDVVVGAPGQTDGNGNAGTVFVFSGDNLGGDPIEVFTGAGESGGNFGASITPVGDLVANDGTADFVVGAPGELSGAGQVYFVDGSTIGSTVSTTTYASPNEGGAFGAAVDSFGTAGDRDVLVGAPAEGGGGTSDGGRAYILDGANPTNSTTLVSQNPEGSGGSQPTSGDFGESVTGIEDVNGDGVSDVLIGAPGETINSGNDREGRAYVFDGATGNFLDELTSPNVTNGGEFGIAVAGLPKPVVGAHQENGSSTTQAGRVYTFRIPEIALVDGRNGETYDPAEASANDSEVPVGRFKLTTDDARSELRSVTVSNQGTAVSDVTSLELWRSTDNSFETSDTKVLETSYAGTATFSSTGEPLSTGGTYFFVVVDLGSDPSGEYDPAIASEADISVADGQIATVNGTQATTFSVADGQGYLSTGPTSPLPVELARLGATASADGVALEWRTASEQNNAGFRIQRRVVAESEDWTRVGRVDGSGTTTTPQTYRFTDDDLPAGSDTLQYRLAQVDLDGSVNLSDPVTVGRGAPSGVQLMDTYPNPARTRATVSLAVPEQASGGATLRLYDVLGRQVRTVDRAVEPGRSTATVDVSGLPSGVYVLRLAADGTTRTRRLTVVK
jgi:hypothetical protein